MFLKKSQNFKLKLTMAGSLVINRSAKAVLDERIAESWKEDSRYNEALFELKTIACKLFIHAWRLISIYDFKK